MDGDGRASRAPGKDPQPPSAQSSSSSASSAPKPRRGSSSLSRTTARVASSERRRPSNNNNNSGRSPRAPPSRSSEPTTEDDGIDDADDSVAPGSLASINDMQKQLTQMLSDVTLKSQKQQRRYNSMRSNVAGKDEQCTRLHATYGDLSQQIAELELLCGGDTDPETLDRLFRSIPRHEQLLSQSSD